LRLIDSCITQLKAQGPSRTCNESKEEEEDHPDHGTDTFKIMREYLVVLQSREREREKERHRERDSERMNGAVESNKITTHRTRLRKPRLG